MSGRTRRSPWEREFQEVWRREQWFLRRYGEKRETALDRKAAELAPDRLMETLHAAFERAFALVLERGSGLILRAGGQERRRAACLARTDAADAEESREALRAFSKAAGRAGAGSTALSGAAGVGMGLFGVTLPDIPLFTALLLKCVYETAESFGFSCDTEAERLYALRVIEAALSYGDALREKGRELDVYAQTGQWLREVPWDRQVRATARRLSEAALYGKVLQNVPVAGAVGGAGDAVCLSRVRRYAAIKYQKRFLLRRRLAAE